MEISNEQKEQVKQAVKATATQPPYLLIVFVLLKAFGVIEWSWFATILFPILLPFMIIFGFLAIVGIVIGIVLLGAILMDFVQRKHRRYKFKKK